MVRRQAWRRPSESSGEPWMPQLLWRPIKNGASLPQWGQIKQLGPFEAYLENRKLSIIQDKSSQVLKVLPSLAIVSPQDSVAITCCWEDTEASFYGTVLELQKWGVTKVATWPSRSVWSWEIGPCQIVQASASRGSHGEQRWPKKRVLELYNQNWISQSYRLWVSVFSSISLHCKKKIIQ